MRDHIDPDDPAVRAFLEAVWDVPPRREVMHERDCAACDVSDEIAGMIACYWDTDTDWYSTPVGDGLPGDMKLTQLARMVAHVLHRRMPGYRRPPEQTIRAAIAEDRRRQGRTDGE